MKYVKSISNGRFLALAMIVITVLSVFGIRLFYRTNDDVHGQTAVLASFYPVYITADNLLRGIDGVTLSDLSEPATGCLHDYTLTPDDMKQLSSSDIFVINGGGIEAFLPDVARDYPSVRIVDTGSHLPDYEGYPISSNPHYWMSIGLYTEQVKAMSKGLEEELTLNRGIDTLRRNTSDYLLELDRLLEKSGQIKPLLDGTDVVLFHEAYEYVACDYGLNVRYLMDLDEERQVSAGEIADVIDAIEEYDIPLILAEETYGKETAKTVAAQTGADVIYLDTIVTDSSGITADSYLERMEDNISKLSVFGSRLNAEQTTPLRLSLH